MNFQYKPVNATITAEWHPSEEATSDLADWNKGVISRRALERTTMSFSNTNPIPQAILQSGEDLEDQEEVTHERFFGENIKRVVRILSGKPHG